MGFVEVAEFPGSFRPAISGRKPPAEYLTAVADAKAHAGKKGVVRVGVPGSVAASMRRWLNKQPGIEARTTGRRDQLAKYGYDADFIAQFIERAAAVEPPVIVDPDDFFVVIACYTPSPESAPETQGDHDED